MSATPRRSRSSVPGIYFRTTADGHRSYEFTYRDADGRQRWQCGYRTLAAAREDRTELQHRRPRGERIVRGDLLIGHARDALIGPPALPMDMTPPRVAEDARRAGRSTMCLGRR